MIKVDSGYQFSNGIAVQHMDDGRPKTLIVAETPTKTLWAYDITGPGLVQNKRVWGKLPGWSVAQITGIPFLFWPRAFCRIARWLRPPRRPFGVFTRADIVQLSLQENTQEAQTEWISTLREIYSLRTGDRHTWKCLAQLAANPSTGSSVRSRNRATCTSDPRPPRFTSLSMILMACGNSSGATKAGKNLQILSHFRDTQASKSRRESKHNLYLSLYTFSVV